jgi:hypothetical protein
VGWLEVGQDRVFVDCVRSFFVCVGVCAWWWEVGWGRSTELPSATAYSVH